MATENEHQKQIILQQMFFGEKQNEKHTQSNAEQKNVRQIVEK